jgi:isoquinoline 1-oxidoreductase beta subunit
LLGIPETDVTVNVTLLGGGFGRKSQPDFVLEAVALAKEVGAPVKVTWTREDEIRHGFYRPENAQFLRAALDADGKVTALLGRSAFSTLLKAIVGPTASTFLPGELDQGWTNLPFAIPNVRMEAGHVTSAVRIGWLRAVCNTFHAFAVGSFVDELAQATGTDSVSMFKQLLGSDRVLSFTGLAGDYTLDTGRLSAVVDRVAGMGLWGKKVPPGEGIGFAAHVSFRSYVAVVIHVAVGDDKVVHVKEVDYAVDVGTVINPDGVEAQVEGGLVFGLSAALFGEITVEEGAVVQGNFDTYPMLRIDRMPNVNVAIIASDEPPTGIGEPPTPVVAPALTNAIFAATGVRLRDLPTSAQGYG